MAGVEAGVNLSMILTEALMCHSKGPSTHPIICWPPQIEPTKPSDGLVKWRLVSVGSIPCHPTSGLACGFESCRSLWPTVRSFIDPTSPTEIHVNLCFV